jgi:hypothetical protein
MKGVTFLYTLCQVACSQFFWGAHSFTVDFHSGEQIEKTSTELLAGRSIWKVGCFPTLLLRWIGPSVVIELTVSLYILLCQIRSKAILLRMWIS